MSLVALVEIRTEDVSQMRKCLELHYVRAFYELMGRFNVGIIVEVKDHQVLFEITTKIRSMPGVKETKTHLIQDGTVI